MSSGTSKILVDGRVYSSSAYDRGMGRYVRHVVDLFRTQGHDVTILLFRDCHLDHDDPMLTGGGVRFANYGPESGLGTPEGLTEEIHGFTAFLSRMIEIDGFDLYIDTTPFLRPLRADVFGCAVMTVLYDFIPLKHPDFYLQNEYDRRIYGNGLARVARADFVVAISRTVATEAGKFLGINPPGIVVVYPALEDRYLSAVPARSRVREDEPDRDRRLFAILGSHKSKNPEGSIEVFRQLLELDRFQIHVNAPKSDQMMLLDAIPRPEEIELTASLTDQEKFDAQRNATIVAHLSLEEGFGIPFLEALFLGTKIIALDIPMNREIICAATSPFESTIFLVPAGVGQIDLLAFERFLNVPSDPSFTEQVREAFLAGWARAGTLLTEAAAAAAKANRAWMKNVDFKIFSSLPGTSCGVADYSVAYVRSTPRNVVVICSEGEEQNIAYLPNIRTATYRDFQRLSQGELANVPNLFNFAFSPALMPGVDLMRAHASKHDVVLIHEREYFGGLRGMMEARKMGDDLVHEFSGESPKARSEAASSLAFHRKFNSRASADPVERSPFSTDWLERLPSRFVSHLTQAVLDRMKQLQLSEPSAVEDDLSGLAQRLEFVPLGIDRRANAGVTRAARRLRTEYGLQQDDVLVGHFGLVIGGGLKRLDDLIDGIASYVRATGAQNNANQKRLFFALVGRVIDCDLFERIEDIFDELGLTGRLLLSNPKLETDFDAHIAACDGVFCLRRQTRGQLSHIFVRALSLGVPVIVNRDSGYGYDASITLRDEALQEDVARVLDLLMDGSASKELKDRARNQYETVHRGDTSLKAILRGSI